MPTNRSSSTTEGDVYFLRINVLTWHQIGRTIDFIKNVFVIISETGRLLFILADFIITCKIIYNTGGLIWFES